MGDSSYLIHYITSPVGSVCFSRYSDLCKHNRCNAHYIITFAIAPFMCNLSESEIPLPAVFDLLKIIHRNFSRFLIGNI